MNWVEGNWSWPFYDFTTSQTATVQALSPRHPDRSSEMHSELAASRSWHQTSIREVLQENIVPCYEPSWNAFPAVLEIALVDENNHFCLFNTEDPTIRMYWCTISWSFAHSENVSLIDFCIQGGMGIVTNSRGVGDDFYLDFLVAWRFGTSLVLGLSVWQKRLSPIVQHMFCVTFATDDIRWYPEIPVTQSFSTFQHVQHVQHGIFQPGGPFSQRCAPGRLVLWEVKRCFIKHGSCWNLPSQKTSSAGSF